MTDKHKNQIADIITNTRIGDESFLIDIRKAAEIIMQYVSYHFELKETFNFDAEPVN